MTFNNALVVKLVDTKDLKVEDLRQSQSVVVQGSKHPVKSHNLN